MMAQGSAYPVQCMCRVLAVAPSGYYAWRRRQNQAAQLIEGSSDHSGNASGAGRRQLENARIVAEMQRIDVEVNHRYGSPRMHAELANRGLVYNRKRVERLMRENGIRAVHSKHRRRVVTTQSQHDLPLAANVLNQEFTATLPNRKWVTDMTYIPTREGWLYLAVVLDLFSRKVVGWAMDTQMTTALPLQALRMALRNRQPQPGLLHHSDRGSQYASYVYQAVLQSEAIQPSMSRTANCYDNAVMESFFASLKAELVHHTRCASIVEARTQIFHYIEAFYNRQRLHSSLGYRSPNAFEASALNGS